MNKKVKNKTNKIKTSTSKIALVLSVFIVSLIAVIFTTNQITKTSYALTPQSGTYDGVDWSIDANGVLTIGKAGETQTFTNRSSRNYLSFSGR